MSAAGDLPSDASPSDVIELTELACSLLDSADEPIDASLSLELELRPSAILDVALVATVQLFGSPSSFPPCLRELAEPGSSFKCHNATVRTSS